MSEQPHGDRTAALDPAKVRETMRSWGVPAAVAAERLSAAMQHVDLAAFETQIAVHRPELWKRMNQRPSLTRRWRNAAHALFRRRRRPSPPR